MHVQLILEDFVRQRKLPIRDLSEPRDVLIDDEVCNSACLR